MSCYADLSCNIHAILRSSIFLNVANKVSTNSSKYEYVTKRTLDVVDADECQCSEPVEIKYALLGRRQKKKI